MIVKIFNMILMSERHFNVMEKELQFCSRNPRQKRKQANHVTLEAYSEPCQTSVRVLFAKIANGLQMHLFFTKGSILDV